MKKARAKDFREYMQKQRLKDPGSIFLNRAARQPLIDLLDAIDAWLTAVDTAIDDFSYESPLGIAVEAMNVVVRRRVKGLRESGLLDAALLDTSHPRFASVHAAIRTAFSVDCETEQQPADGQSGPRIVN